MSGLSASTWFSNQQLRIKGLVVIAVPLVVLIGALASGFLIGSQTERAQDEVRRTLEIQHDIQEVHTRLAEAATGVRGYLLTGQERFLDRYKVAEAEQPKTLARLRTQIRDPLQAERLDSLSRLARKKSEGLSELLRLGPDAPPRQLRPILVANKEVLDELRSHIDQMLARELILRMESQRYAERVNDRVKWVIAVAGVAGILGTLLTVYLFSTGIVRRVEALARNAELLERGAPLIPMEPARDELGQLASRMAQASTLLAVRAAEVQKARDEAERANQAKTDFLSRTSHELRTPLTAILGYAQLLERDPAAPDAANSVGLIIKGGQHLLELINDVLDIARIETGRLDIALQAVPLAGVVQEALTLHAAAAEAKGITLSGPGELGAIAVLGDRRRLLQVILNLLSNAVKYTQSGGSVSVNVSYDARRARISIVDNGPGIPAQEHARLFTPFERLGAERNAVEGSGLGLAVSKQLVKAMGGEIGVASAAGSGSTFWIDLPASAPATVPEPPKAAPQPLPAAPGRNVLYIDDGQSSLVLVETLLARRGNVALHGAHSMAQAMAMLAKLRPDLILIDMHDTGAAGALLRSLRSMANAGDAPVVALQSGAGAEALRAAGAIEVLGKPIEVQRFVSMMDRFIP